MGALKVTFVYDGKGTPASVTLDAGMGAARYSYVYNGHGDVVALTDSSGNVVASYSYDEFGNLTNSSENFPGATYGWSNPYRYDGAQGVRYDPETGLYWMSVRAYDPTLGRFISHDPLGRLATQEVDNKPYVYAGNNPVNKTDPLGLYVARGSLVDGGSVASGRSHTPPPKPKRPKLLHCTGEHPAGIPNICAIDIGSDASIIWGIGQAGIQGLLKFMRIQLDLANSLPESTSEDAWLKWFLTGLGGGIGGVIGSACGPAAPFCEGALGSILGAVGWLIGSNQEQADNDALKAYKHGLQAQIMKGIRTLTSLSARIAGADAISNYNLDNEMVMELDRAGNVPLVLAGGGIKVTYSACAQSSLCKRFSK